MFYDWRLAQSAVKCISHGLEAPLDRKSGSRSTPSNLLRCATMAPRVSSSLAWWPLSHAVKVMMIFGKFRTRPLLRAPAQGRRQAGPPVWRGWEVRLASCAVVSL
eukprot:scaffold80867_cov27-Tisochrysis_lutea.AAC.1